MPAHVETPGEHVVETIRISVTGPALSLFPSDVLGQTGGGDIGGMFIAVLFLVGLGLAVVALWHGGLSELLDELGLSSGGDATGRKPPESRQSASAKADSPADTGSQQELETEPVEEELTDRDIVLDILDENDGRMKQARIVDATDWSKSKVSMVLSDMEEDGDITKLRVGRENIISLEGSEPEAAGSPFDDE